MPEKTPNQSQHLRRELEVLRTAHGHTAKGAEFHEVELRVPEDLLYLSGHFPGDPVLPGVVQLNTVAMAQIEQIWPELGRLEQIRRLKFIHIIGPGERIRLRLEKRANPLQISLVILRDETLCTSGILVFTGPFPSG